jgi:hypothetical protein
VEARELRELHTVVSDFDAVRVHFVEPRTQRRTGTRDPVVGLIIGGRRRCRTSRADEDQNEQQAHFQCTSIVHFALITAVSKRTGRAPMTIDDENRDEKSRHKLASVYELK